jgi:hypothetical protein
VQRVLSCTCILADGSHTNPGRHELACRDVSEQRASQQTDHLDLLVCKLAILICQSANLSILQLVRELIDCFAYSLSLFADCCFANLGEKLKGKQFAD